MTKATTPNWVDAGIRKTVIIVIQRHQNDNDRDDNDDAAVS